MRRLIIALAVCAATCFAPASSHADVVFLATGDSLVFGTDPSYAPAMTPSYGDQGWVKLVADGLASVNGGVRPTVANYAIPGELTETYITAVSPPGWTARGWGFNQHYADGNSPQYNAVLDRIQAEHLAGNSIGYISLLLGANDALFLVNTPAFQTATPDVQQSLLTTTLGAAMTRYASIFGALKTAAPEAKFILPGYYNPMPAGSPYQPLYQSIVQSYNAFIAATAASAGATYVDLATPILGRELELTNIGAGDTHPNQLGYQVIGSTINRTFTLTAVPEPGSMALLGLGGVAVLAYARRRRV